jgi:hypothetical protein
MHFHTTGFIYALLLPTSNSTIMIVINTPGCLNLGLIVCGGLFLSRCFEQTIGLLEYTLLLCEMCTTWKSKWTNLLSVSHSRLRNINFSFENWGLLKWEVIYLHFCSLHANTIHIIRGVCSRTAWSSFSGSCLSECNWAPGSFYRCMPLNLSKFADRLPFE